MGVDILDLGLIKYDEALNIQLDLLEKRSEGQIEDTLVFCSHPPVVTLGRSAQPGDLGSWSGDTVKVSRGGRATFHGPNQLIVYPICSLKNPSMMGVKEKDVMSFLLSFEELVLQTLKSLGFDSLRLKEDTSFDENGKKLLNRGIWSEEKKLVAFGIGVRKWITFHGCAINLYNDDLGFGGISPCGYQASNVGYLNEIKDLAGDELRSLVSQSLIELTRIYWGTT